MHTVIADNRLFIIPLDPQAMFHVYKVALNLRDVTRAKQKSVGNETHINATGQ